MWSWAILGVAAVYSTLGPAQILVAALGERNLLRISFALLLVLIGFTIIVRWF